jgi:hypothetical protein
MSLSLALIQNHSISMTSDFDSFINSSDNNENSNSFESIKNQVLNDEINIDDLDDEIEEQNEEDKNCSAITKFALNYRDDENSHKASDILDSEFVEDEIWKYRCGHAYNETQKEYEILRTYLEMGRSRNTIQLKRIFTLTDSYVKKVREKNNWVERIDAYDRNTYLNALSEETSAREEEHRKKLEIYRARQETIADQAAMGAARMLHLVNSKLAKLVDNGDSLSVDEMIGVGNLTVKLVSMQKEVGAQALGVDALLEAIDEDNVSS